MRNPPHAAGCPGRDKGHEPLSCAQYLAVLRAVAETPQAARDALKRAGSGRTTPVLSSHAQAIYMRALRAGEGTTIDIMTATLAEASLRARAEARMMVLPGEGDGVNYIADMLGDWAANIRELKESADG